MSWQTDCVKVLGESQRPDGGWSYFAGGDSAVEPTADAIAALYVLDEHKSEREHGLAFIASMKNADNSLRPQPSQTDGTTIAALAGIVTAACGGDPAFANAIATRLLGFDPETAPKTADIADDPSLLGFSWLPKTYSWVEPTGYGVILLHHVGRDASSRRDEAQKMLIDRAIPTGGWNYGNSRVFANILEPQPMTTGVALLGLWDETQSPVIANGIKYLKSVEADVPSVLSLGWVTMALRARGIDIVKAERFGELFDHSVRSATSPWHRAVAMLATLPLDRNPFVIKGSTP